MWTEVESYRLIPDVALETSALRGPAGILLVEISLKKEGELFLLRRGDVFLSRPIISSGTVNVDMSPRPF